MTEDRPPSAGPAGLLAAVLAATCLAASAGSQELPRSAPAPELLRENRPEADAPPAAVPLPQPRPRRATAAEDPQSPPVSTRGDTVPLPAESPIAPTPAVAADPRSAMRADASGKLPVAEEECRRRLAALGAEFEERDAEFNAAVGCSVPYPLMLRSFGRGVELEPAAEMSCAMAEATARFVQEVAAPAARDVFGKGLDSVSQASAYVCRPRHGGRKLSEHAFGNALDIAAFTLVDGTPVAVELRPETEPAIFLGRLRRAACGPFSTVLGPGSDAGHATHLHFDLQPRRSGGSFCR